MGKSKTKCSGTFNSHYIIINYISVNVVEENAFGVGSWGGECMCPDGKSYQVGTDLSALQLASNDPIMWAILRGTDSCKRLACINGQRSINCNEYAGPWSGRKVTCGVSKSRTKGTTTALML